MTLLEQVVAAGRQLTEHQRGNGPAGDRPFDDLDKYITQDELRALSESYKRVAGFSLADVA